MEKRTPHCNLAVVKALVAAGKVRATFFGAGGRSGFGIRVRRDRRRHRGAHAKDFYKSMTTHADHRIWQDVYRPKTPASDVYLKLTVIDDVLIVSFKEL